MPWTGAAQDQVRSQTRTTADFIEGKHPPVALNAIVPAGHRGRRHAHSHPRHHQRQQRGGKERCRPGTRPAENLVLGVLGRSHLPLLGIPLLRGRWKPSDARRDEQQHHRPGSRPNWPNSAPSSLPRLTRSTLAPVNLSCSRLQRVTVMARRKSRRALQGTTTSCPELRLRCILLDQLRTCSWCRKRSPDLPNSQNSANGEAEARSGVTRGNRGPIPHTVVIGYMYEKLL